MIRLTAFILFVAVCFSNSKSFALDVILVPLSKSQAHEMAKAQTLLRATNVRPVFSPDEQKALAKANRSTLAQSKFATVNGASFAEAQRLLVKAKLRISVEPAEIDLKLSEVDFESRLWGFENRGGTFDISTGDASSLTYPAKAGEDIGLNRAPPESLDPKRQTHVFVLDSGVNYAHPELADRIYENVPECQALARFNQCHKNADALKAQESKTAAKKECDSKLGSIDADGNGYPLDCAGWNVTWKGLSGDNVWGNADAADGIGHGTHVIGIINARNDDGGGVRGVSQTARVTPVKVITAAPNQPLQPLDGGRNLIETYPAPSPRESNPSKAKNTGDIIARGLLYAIRSGAQVINMSLGWPPKADSELVQQMIDLALSRDILIVAAAGNDGTDALVRPCTFRGVICVGSHDPDGVLSHFSNYGPGVDIAAPGLNILSLFPLNIRQLRPEIFLERAAYEMKFGTSMSTPFVTGILARLLNAGFSPREAKARLLAAARPASNGATRAPMLLPMAIQTGNADLAEAFRVIPRPIFMPVAKQAVVIPWDRLKKTLNFNVPIENIWADAKDVKIHFRIAGNDSRDARLEPSSVNFQSWNGGQAKDIPLELKIDSDRVASDLRIEVTIDSKDEKSGRAYRENRLVAVNIYATPTADDPEVKKLALLGDHSALKNAVLRTVTSVDGRREQDYIARQDIDENTQRLALITQEKNGYLIRGTAIVSHPKWKILLLQRTDIDGDGASDYVVIWNEKKPEKATPRYLFLFFDSQFRPLPQNLNGQFSAEAIFDQSATVLTDSFQWVKYGSRRVIAWVSRGTTPENEKPKFDPWNPEPIEFPKFNLFYWNENGLNTVPFGDNSPIAYLPATAEELRTGTRRVLSVQGDGTSATYSVAVLSDLASEKKIGEQKSLDFGGYRRIRSTMMPSLISLSSGTRDAGTALGATFYSPSYKSAMRASGVVTDPSAESKMVFDLTVEPSWPVDQTTSVFVGFYGNDGSGALISQSLYRLLYLDTRTGEKAETSLNRYSFMPEFIFETQFFPAVGEDRGSRKRLPMLYLAEGFGTTNSAEIMAPRYESGRLQSFIRPARLRFAAPQGCEMMGDMVSASSDSPAKMVFYCGDHFLQAPVSY